MRLDHGLVPRMVGARRVDQAPVVAGQLGVPPVDLRVIQVRLAHPGLEVIRGELPRRPAEELERGHVRLGPRPLGHADHGADEQVPRVRQHHRERPHPAAPARRRIRPQPQVPVIHLGFGTRRHRRAGDPHLPGPRLAREMRPHVAAHAGHARGQPLLVGQPLVDHRHRHHADQPGDPVMVHRDLPPGHLPYSRAGDLREPLPGQRPPLLRASPAGRPAPSRPPPPAATYRRTVLASTPRLRATSTFGRPAYQCSRISVTSTIVNVLLAISVLRPEADERHTQLEGPEAEPSPAPPAPRENADREGRELPDRGGSLTREFRDRQHASTRRPPS